MYIEIEKILKKDSDVLDSLVDNFLNKELKKQVESGKELISDDSIDSIMKDAISDFKNKDLDTDSKNNESLHNRICKSVSKELNNDLNKTVHVTLLNKIIEDSYLEVKK